MFSPPFLLIELKNIFSLLHSQIFPEINEHSLWALFCLSSCSRNLVTLGQNTQEWQVRTVPDICYVKQGDPGLMGELGPPGLKGLQVSYMSRTALFLTNIISTLRWVHRVFVLSCLMLFSFFKLIPPPHSIFIYWYYFPHFREVLASQVPKVWMDFMARK